MAKKRKSSPTTFAADWALSGAFAAATLWHRMSFMGAFAMMSDADRQSEMARMVHEKIAAGFEGGLDAGVEAMRVMAAAVSGKIGPADLMNASSSIMSAGLQPAMRRVRANSRRLNRHATKS